MRLIAETMQEWIEISKSLRHVRTIQWHYLPMVQLYLEIVGDHPLNEFSIQHADKFITGLKANGKLSPVTINNRIKRLKVFLTWSYEREYLDRIPKIHLLREYRQTPQILTMPEVSALIQRIASLKKNAANEYLRRCHLLHERFLMILLATGCRRSEAFYLRWQDVDFGRNTMLFRNQEHNKIKEGRDKTVRLPDYLAIYLKNQRLNYPSESYLLDNGQSEILYSDPYALTKAFRRHLQALGLSGRKIKPLHGFRALFVDRLFNELDIPLDVVQTMLGHSDIRVTQGYLPRTDKRHKKTVAQLHEYDKTFV